MVSGFHGREPAGSGENTNAADGTCRPDHDVGVARLGQAADVVLVQVGDDYGLSVACCVAEPAQPGAQGLLRADLEPGQPAVQHPCHSAGKIAGVGDRGPVQRRDASSQQKVGRQLDATWSGRICTWPVLTTDTRRIGSVTFISVFSSAGQQYLARGILRDHGPLRAPLGAGRLGCGSSAASGAGPSPSRMPYRRCSKRSGPGAHQFASPTRRMVAGTSSIRTRVASRMRATIMPTPIILMNVMLDRENAPITITSSSAALVMTPPVRCRPLAMEAVLSPVMS